VASLLKFRPDRSQETKDDSNFVVKFALAANSMFSFYEECIKAVDGTDGPEVSAAVDFVFAEADPRKRAEIAEKLESCRGTIIRQIVDFVLERDGKHLSFKVAVKRNVEELWKIIGDWYDVSWVQGATGVEVDMGPPAVRTIKFLRGETFEVLTARSDEDRYLSYTVERSAGMPVDILKDNLTLAARSDGADSVSTVINSSLVLLAKEQQDADQVAAKVKELFESRIKWVQTTFSKPKQGSSEDLYFGKLDTTKKIFHTATSGVIDAPVDDIWAVFRKFGEMDSWWQDYYAGEITVNRGVKDKPEVGQKRSFKTISGRAYEEELVELNDTDHRMVYSLSSMSPAMLTGAVTIIDFDADEGNPSRARVTWSSACTLDDKFVTHAVEASEGQKKAYDIGISNLQLFFSHAKGPTLIATVATGAMALVHSDYLVLSVGGGSSERVDLSRSGAPRSSVQMTFPIADMNDSLNVRVMDDRSVVEERQVGFGSVELKDLAGKSNYVLSVKDSTAKDVGNVTLSVRMENVKVSAADQAQMMAETLGKVALRLGGELSKNISAISREMSEDINAKWHYASYSEEFGPLPKFCQVLPVAEAIVPHRTGQFFERFQEYIYSQIPLVKALADPAIGAKMMQSDLHASILRGYIQSPEKVVERWSHDEELCAQMLRGVNPMKVTVVKDTSMLPNGFESLKDDAGRSVDQLIAEKSLFYCDYFELKQGEFNDEDGYYTHQARLDVIGVNLGPRKYWYAPVLAMYKRKESGKLSILGFQLTRHSSKPNETYTKATHPENIYKLAKLHLTCADNQHHQFASHLGLTHLLMEPFAIALHNAFPSDAKTRERHPVAKLLQVHFHDTIGINFLARHTLVSEVAPVTDATFSPGTKSALKIFSSAYQRWSFIGSNFVNDLKSRGFDEECSDGLPGYYYRDDGFKLWNAFVQYVESVVNELYAEDRHVADDAALQVWCDEMTGPCGIDSFPKKFASKSELVLTIVSIMFYCSAQHAAVNFPQQRYVAYMPNRPDSLRTPMVAPASPGADIPPEAIAHAFPEMLNVEFQALLAHLLTIPPDNPFSAYSATDTDFPVQSKAFKTHLSEISRNIQARNKALEEAGEIPYEYLDPERVPQSINI
jgi:arachidonate 15-lipoxygenase